MQKFRKTPKASDGRRLRGYEFGPFRIDLIKRVLLREGEFVSLTPKVFETLVALVENRGEVLLKEELIERIWPDVVVEEGSLNRNISTLRKVLGESPSDHEYVVTIPRRGYRFVGEIRESWVEPARPIDRPIDQPLESVAVLPFLNLSGDSGQEYFADGLTEALITDLAQVHALRVVSRTSVMRYKNARTSLPQIARELHVDGVVEGSVMHADERVRITVQLIDGQTDRHLWANAYDGKLSDALSLLSAVARAIVREIRVALTPTEQTRLATVRLVTPTAYEAYLKGRYFWNQRTPESLKRSIAYFEQAIRIDRSYALAHVALAQAYTVMVADGFQSPRELVPKAMQAVRQALKLDAELGEAHATLAFLMFIHELDFAGAEQRFRSALSLSPSDSTARHWYGLLLLYQRRFDESLQELQKAQGLDPLAPIIRAALGLGYVFAGKYDDAIQQADSQLAFAVLGLAHQHLGNHPQAIADLRRYVHLSDHDADALMRLGCAYAQSGDKRKARTILRQLQARSKKYYVSPVSLAALELALGDTEHAVAMLNAGLEQRASSVLMLAADPAFAPLRSDPRFQALLRKIGLPTESG
jgi:TolB-like protein/Flp pilus assembly protein TadD